MSIPTPFLVPTDFKSVLAAGQDNLPYGCLLCVRGLEPGRLRAAALDIRKRRSLALTLYQTDFTINHVINVMEHEHPSLFSFAYSARGLIVRTILT